MCPGSEPGTLPVVERPLQSGVNLTTIPVAIRTRNCLIRAGLIAEPARLNSLKYADLFAIRGMGVRSVLDVTTALEAVATAAEPLAEAAGPVSHDVPSLLQDVAAAPWAEMVSSGDPRFGGRLRFLGRGVLAQAVEAWSEGVKPMQVDDELLHSELKDVIAYVADLGQKPLEDGLEDYVAALIAARAGGPRPRLADQRLNELLARLGLAGGEPSTIEEAGQLMGVTRERVRQLQRKVELARPSHPVVMPALDAALDLVRAQAPMPDETLGDLLIEHGLSRRRFHPESLLAAARFCGRDSGFVVEQVGGHPWVRCLFRGARSRQHAGRYRRRR